MTVRAVLLIPAGDIDEAQRWAHRDECLEHCKRREYAVVGVAARWEDAAYVVLQREADIVVAARNDHFPADRVPRTETPETAPADPGAPPRERRARLARRGRASE
jgi:hypothetical protein